MMRYDDWNNDMILIIGVLQEIDDDVIDNNDDKDDEENE